MSTTLIDDLTTALADIAKGFTEHDEVADKHWDAFDAAEQAIIDTYNKDRSAFNIHAALRQAGERFIETVNETLPEGNVQGAIDKYRLAGTIPAGGLFDASQQAISDAVARDADPSSTLFNDLLHGAIMVQEGFNQLMSLIYMTEAVKAGAVTLELIEEDDSEEETA